VCIETAGALDLDLPGDADAFEKAVRMFLRELAIKRLPFSGRQRHLDAAGFFVDRAITFL